MLLAITAPQRHDTSPLKRSVKTSPKTHKKDKHLRGQETKGSGHHLQVSTDHSEKQSPVRPKRTSLIRHKGTLSVDVLMPSSSPRPAGSPVVAQADTVLHSQESPVTTEMGTLVSSDSSRSACKTMEAISDFTAPSQPSQPPTGQVNAIASRRPSDLTTTSDYTPSWHNGGDSPCSGNGARGENGSKGRWLSKAKDWFSTKELSNERWKQYQKETFKKHGVALNDVDADAKLNAPIGTLPATTIQPSKGPRPGKVCQRQKDQRHRVRQSSSSAFMPSSQLMPSTTVSTASIVEGSDIAPWC